MERIFQHVLQGVKDQAISKELASKILKEVQLKVQQHESQGTLIAGGHPLLQENVSDLTVQRFVSRFSGEEFFLADHEVMGARVLPGVAYLEMAREAGRRALSSERVGVYNTHWLRPVVCGDEGIEVSIELGTLEDGRIGFDVLTGEGETSVVHAQGELRALSEALAVSVDVEALQARCGHRVEGEDCYGVFAELGLVYGPGHRSVDYLQVGDSEVLARLSVPSSVLGSAGEYGLHPGVLDGALQASAGLDIGKDETGAGLYLPFALAEAELLGETSASAVWAHVRYAAGGSGAAAERVLDIDLLTDSGELVVRLGGFSSRLLESLVSDSSASELAPTTEMVAAQALLMTPHWSSLDHVAETTARWASQHIIVCPGISTQAEFSASTVHHLEASEDGDAQSYAGAVRAVLSQAQSLASAGPSGQVLLQVLVPLGSVYEGIAALLRTVNQELPSIAVQLIAVDGDAGDLKSVLQRAAGYAGESVLRLLGTELQAQRWEEVETETNPETTNIKTATTEVPWREGGIYLISGGAGGLGRLLAGEIAREAGGATLVLSGRSALNEQTEALLSELESQGVQAVYRQADLGDAGSVQELVDWVVVNHGELNGVVHAAGVQRDELLMTQSVADVEAVLSAKVLGAENLHAATRAQPLDFVLLYGSVAGVLGNVGQSAYAAANGYLGAFASRRNVQREAGDCSGLTQVIAWPLWESAGMGVDAATQDRLALFGVVPMPAVEGFEQQRAILRRGAELTLLMFGVKDRLLKLFDTLSNTKQSKDLSSEKKQPASSDSVSVDFNLLEEKTRQFLRSLLANIMKLEADRIGADVSLEEYGLDSVMVVELVNGLESSFGALSKTLLFEHQSLSALTGYFVTQHTDQLRNVLGLATQAPKDDTKALPPTVALPLNVAGTRRFSRYGQSDLQQAKAAVLPVAGVARMDIAIVGLSGRYPQARTLSEFWSLLRSGTNAVSEVPAARWDWREYWSEKRGEAGKIYSRWGGFIDGVDEFDPLFFRISPKEAEAMDPQERLFLQTAYGCLEDAGYGGAVSGQVGVFAGVMYEEYPYLGITPSGPMGLPATPASIANRVSYMFDFHGPSMTVDSMCSSSLTAIHLACDSLRRGDCEVALAGGVNASVHPNKYMTLSQTGFASSEGLCRSFGADGDGYVPGEGVGAVLLKPLSVAEADGDHIYGVIRGSAMNHGGRTNGYTVPSPVRQGEVVAQALKVAGVEGREINYVEAHGTGTSLGDPIEIAGLTRAFGIDTSEQITCAIGSVKSNIGHCESAAGIAGLTKVLLQMEHGELVPSLHSEKLNPHIDFEATPFRVQQGLSEWERPAGGKRLAGLSSFGAGGSNVHLVVEEYVAAERSVAEESGPYVYVLSARTELQLRERAEQFVGASEAGDFEGYGSSDVAYTLQVGREGLEYRLGFSGAGTEDFVRALKVWLSGEIDPSLTVYTGQAKSGKQATSVFAHDDDLQEAIARWVARGKTDKLLSLWVQGLVFDWSQLHEGAKPQRVSLPTYPFARESYWVSGVSRVAASLPGVKTRLHPLLQENVSDLTVQRFVSRFSGEEFFLADHEVMGARVLPGVAYLEMAREAGRRALSSERVGVYNTHWLRPVVCGDEGIEVSIELGTLEDGRIGFDVLTGEGETSVVHAQGELRALSEALAVSVDVEALQARCGHRVEGEDCYGVFAELGLVYGPGHRSVDYLQVGDSEVLARLSVPSSVLGSAGEYGLHPGVLDGALQASAGLDIGKDETGAGLYLPFALAEAELLGETSASAVWAHVRYAAGGSGAAAERVLDIDLLTDSGELVVRLGGFSSRLLESLVSDSSASELAPTTEMVAAQALLMTPHWSSLDHVAETTARWASQHIIVCPGISTQAEFSASTVHHLEASEDGDAQSYAGAVRAVLSQAQSLASAGPSGQVLLQVLVPLGSVYEGIAALLRTVNQELPSIAVQLIAVDGDAGDLKSVLQRAAGYAGESVLRLLGTELQAQRWEEAATVASETTTTEVPWREGGIYLISGGAGGLGRLLAGEIAREAGGATLVLSGRSALNEQTEALLSELESQGVQAVYRQADLGDAGSVQELVDWVVVNHGELNGVVHAAGVQRDELLMTQSVADVEAVLSAKVLGAENLHAATRAQPLDFVLLYGSVAGVLGNVGQSAYAAANGYLGAFASRRNVQREAGDCSGLTQVIAWPLWESAGMGVDAATQDRLALFGVVPMPAVEGFEQQRAILRRGAELTLLMFGVHSQLQKLILGLTESPLPLPLPLPLPDQTGSSIANLVPIKEGSDTTLLMDKARNYLRELLSESIKLDVNRIDADASLEEYGLDSMTVVELVNVLERSFGALSKTLLFEHQNLSALAAYFVSHHEQALRELLGLSNEGKEQGAPRYKKSIAESLKPGGRRFSRFSASHVTVSSQQEANPIAIVGLSGRYPQARTLSEFWSLLRSGTNAVSEVPAARWDWREYWSEKRGEAGKIYSRWGGFIDGVDEFDPLFFRISPKEAEAMDPQERLFLQTAYGCLEDAGYGGSGLSGQVGVFAGVMYEEYAYLGITPDGPMGLPATPASIANRVSYMFDFHGPSMTVDSMCSSSLTAIHLACDSLRRGDCEVALAGGVNASVHPNKYMTLSQTGFASSEGLCRSFGADGDGYVPGEGVGAVLLKPLSVAEADGDHIYGVIRGSAMNHGGRTNGYTVPSPVRQGEVVAQALKVAGVEGREINYVEAHGTGTSLGDPIEIAGLTRAFGIDTSEQITCAIGSVKSNIGHCESAAGIAGLTKVLLQMEHGELVPSLHSEKLNPHIDFEATPFRVQQGLSEWERPAGGKRLAGLSSFGAGGSNVHLVVEEYVAAEREVAEVAGPYVYVLSARTELQLRERAEQFVGASEAGEFEGCGSSDVAYTLQVGREGLEYRLGFSGAGTEEFVRALKVWLSGEIDPSLTVYTGQAKSGKQATSVFAHDDDLQEAIARWVARGKTDKLLSLWVQGLVFDWSQLHEGAKPQRVSLPTYPFARESYWVNASVWGEKNTQHNAMQRFRQLHPLLHENESLLHLQRYKSYFSGEEFFLADHEVMGARVLPGVAYLEMAREAGRRALGVDRVGVYNTHWLRPVVCGDEGIEVSIELGTLEDGRIGFDVLTGEGETSVVHAQGELRALSEALAVSVDVEALQSRCSHRVEGEDCYGVFAELGLVYGPGHRSVDYLQVGDSEVLARLSVPSSVLGSAGEYGLHPGVLDGALQASAGLDVGKDETGAGLYLPFALAEAELLGETSASAVWAHVRYAAGGSGAAAERVLDIDLLTDSGELVARLGGFSSRLLESLVSDSSASELAPTTEMAAAQALLMTPHWSSLDHVAESPTRWASQHIIVCPGISTQAEFSALSVQHLEASEDGDAQSYAGAVRAVLSQAQSLASAGPSGQALLQVLVPLGSVYEGLAALLRTVNQELPSIAVQLIAVDGHAGDLESVLQRASAYAGESVLRLLGTELQAQRWEESDRDTTTTEVPWREGGIYLISGGAGGLGRLLAGEIAREAGGATLVLSGRSALNEQTEALLSELESQGVQAVYRQADLGDAASVQELVDWVVVNHGELNGVVHAAGVQRDELLMTQSVADVEAVLSAKVLGVENLHAATRAQPLDFVLLYGSVAGVLGNVGQSAYAAANGYLGAFASRRNVQREAGDCSGLTQVIAWPLWESAGMGVDAATQDRLALFGVVPMPAVEGFEQQRDILRRGSELTLLMYGEQERLRLIVTEMTNPVSKASTPNSASGQSISKDNKALQSETHSEIEESILLSKACDYLKSVLAKSIRLDESLINIDASLDEYGLDSVIVVEMVNVLERSFGALSKTLLFEYQSLSALAGYFVSQHTEQLRDVLGLNAQTPRDNAKALPPTVAMPLSVAGTRRFSRYGQSELQQAKAAALPIAGVARIDIAIVGLSGRYPQARTLSEFWSLLRSGTNAVSEVPASRWDWREYWSEKRGEAGKIYSRWGGFIDGVDEFDPLFFRISPKEAEAMDPQERLFLQTAYGCLEDAGYGGAVSGQVGVFAGVMNADYATGARYWSIANRVSYYLDLSGPSMVVDTACSSSLTAIHLACESLRRGESTAALAGGVNLALDPVHYMGMSAMTMLSSGDECRAFGEGADGFVDGEGVGAVLLKPLSVAEADGDHIYGVIRGSAMNHGGRTNGYTVPSPVRQGEVVAQALKVAGVEGREINYVEAHGTGTSLGDPIEIAGLTRAFGIDTSEQITCAIGSVKSNIGHCESAAGIAGLTKVLLQMEHGELVPSLHSEKLNPHIDFDSTPFRVQQGLSEWARPAGGKRLAGLSSFGAGGSNVHLVVEEYVAAEREVAEVAGPYVYVLSARTELQLRERAEQFVGASEAGEFEGYGSSDVAYTLQVGREGLEYRLGFSGAGTEEFVRALKVWLSGEIDPSLTVYTGQAKSGKQATSVFAHDDDLQEAIARWVARGKTDKLLSLWVQGLVFDWSQLHEGTKPQRVSLPTYPFARESYWVSGVSRVAASLPGVKALLHPLLQENVSDLTVQRFVSCFSGEEFFLADHEVLGARVLPGVAYLEMAREAGRRALSTERVGVYNTHWLRPVVCGDEGIEVSIELGTLEDGRIGFDVLTGEGESSVVHAQGELRALSEALAASVDVEALQARCGHRVEGEDCYGVFAELGLVYGPGHRSVDYLQVGDSEVLARLSVPSSVLSSAGEYGLHPGVLDGALQASAGLDIGKDVGKDETGAGLYLPFALAEAELLGETSASAVWAHVRYAAGGSGAAAERVLDIDLLTDAGEVLVRLGGFSSRLLESLISDSPAFEQAPAEQATEAQALLMTPHWSSLGEETEAPAHWASQHIIVCPGTTTQAKFSASSVHHLEASEDGDAQSYAGAVRAVLSQAQSLASAGPSGQALLQVLVPLGSVYEGLAALLRTVNQELPSIGVQLIAVDGDAGDLESVLQRASAYAGESVLRLLGTELQAQRWEEVETETNPETTNIKTATTEVPWREGGIYLISGGAGGLGRLLAGEIAREAGGATLVLSGRSALNEQTEALLSELESQGVQAVYRQADLGDAASVQELVDWVVVNHGELNGVVHAAGVQRDELLMTQSVADVEAVLSAKVLGVENLHAATRAQPLDFVLLYGSVAGVLGNVGQSAYAAANGYLGAFASRRNEQREAGDCSGLTQVIAWPLWESAGMGVDAATQDRLALFGVVPMPAVEGFEQQRDILRRGSELTLLMFGDSRLKSFVLSVTNEAVNQDTPDSTEAAPELVLTESGLERLRDNACNYLRSLLAQTIKLDPARVDVNASLDSYGLDSVMVVEIVSLLERSFGPLSKTLLFEHQSLSALALYLVKNHESGLRELLGLSENLGGKVSPSSINMAVTNTVTSLRRFARYSGGINSTPAQAEVGPIAIVGLSGRYPQARTLSEFWSLLRSGTNAVSEVPASRWDWREYWSEKRGEAGKIYSRWGGFIDGVDEFDPLFFRISPKEAEAMDPQERLFLQTAYGCLEDAGYGGAVSGQVGVFAGVMNADYATGARYWSIANRVSYYLDLSGPSMVVDTACSSSLTAIHLACESLRRGESTAALAGGVNLALDPVHYMGMSAMTMLSSGDECRAFGEGADGFVDGEGVGAVLLKPLSVAEADGDHIYGVIRGSAMNHGGRTNGYTVPSPVRQGEVVAQALKVAGVEGREINYVEAHGTGTSLGDPIEIAGLTRAFGIDTSEDVTCAIGSVKSNIGHCESAAGIAGLTKVLLQMEHGELVPSLHSEKLNPHIDFEATPFRVQQGLSDWERPAGGKRLAGLSSFGAGGSNVHLVVEEYVAAEREVAEVAGPYVYVLSARTELQLRERAEQFVGASEAGEFEGVGSSDVAYTLQVGREGLEYRLGFSGAGTEEFVRALKVWLSGEIDPSLTVYTGQVKSGKDVIGVFSQDDMSRNAEEWITDLRYDKLLQLWVQGFAFDWTLLHPNVQPKRVSLPTYPFARSSYPISPRTHNSTKTEALRSPQKNGVIADEHDFGEVYDMVSSGDVSQQKIIDLINRNIG